jgi:triacylglycerol lipase
VTYEPDATPMTNAAWQIKFVSRDMNGQPIAAVATVVKPLIAPSGTPNLLVDAFAEDGLGAQCAPSHGVTGSTADSNELLETGVPTAGLAVGWTVVYPDYEGPYSEYAVGRLSAQITLDSIRAAEQFAPLGLNAQTPVGINGYSGGAIAASWVATLQHSYAPNLNIVGIASGGTPADITGIVTNIDTNTVSNAAFFSIIFMASIGINRGYPQFMTPILNAAGAAAATAMENGCVGKDSNGSSGPTGSFPDYTTTSNFEVAPGFVQGSALDSLPQPNEPPVTSEFVYQSQTDELIPITGVDAMVKAWCAQGAHIAYYRALSGDHVSTEIDNEQFVIAYLSESFSATTPIYPPTTTVCN